MWQNAYDAYLESRILAGDGMELVQLMYQACTGAVRDARRHLAEGSIQERSRAISKAWEILAELSGSLDRQRGGELAGSLAELYDYMQRRLLEANAQQSDAPLAEVLGLLTTLGEAWEGVRQQERPHTAAANVWGAQAREVQAPVVETAGCWSL